MSRVAKHFRLLRRNEDRSSVLECTDAEGYALLTIHADGSRSMHMVEGVCGDCMAGRHAHADCPWRDRDKAPVPERRTNWQQGVGDSLGEILKAQPPPYVSEPEPEPVKPKERANRHRRAKAPEPPADPLLDSAARNIAKRVWSWPGGAMWPSQLWAIGTAEPEKRRVLEYGVKQGWFEVLPSSEIVKGKNHPEPLLTYAIPNGSYRSLDR
jgi:hypothetical protein